MSNPSTRQEGAATPGPWEVANARLIADLLEVARRVAEHFKDTDAPLGQLARAAIAKAEGQS